MTSRDKDLVAAACRMIVETSNDPKEDARNERLKASFDVDEMAGFVNDGKEGIERRCVRYRESTRPVMHLFSTTKH